MERMDTEKINAMINLLGSSHLEDRLMAINILGEIGDETALKKLREKLVIVNQELQALITAVGKLKNKINLK